MTLSQSQYNRLLAQNKQLYKEMVARREVEMKIRNIILETCGIEDVDNFLLKKKTELDEVEMLAQDILRELK